MRATDEDVRAWARERWPDVNWNRADVRSGAFHHVVLPEGGPIMRGAVETGHAQRVARELAVAEVVTRLGLTSRVPDVLAGPVGDEWMTAMLTSRVAGGPAPDEPWSPAFANTYRRILADLSSAEVGASSLPPPRSWCGGPDWPHLVQIVTSALSGDLQQLAARLVGAVLEAEVGAEWCFVHGDFGPHNVLWRGAEAISLIDFDHACVGDPAIDVAPLIGIYGAAAVGSIVDPPLLARAMVHRATLSLQLACAAHLVGQDQLRDHALTNFRRRAVAGTLYDPDASTTVERRSEPPVGSGA